MGSQELFEHAEHAEHAEHEEKWMDAMAATVLDAAQGLGLRVQGLGIRVLRVEGLRAKRWGVSKRE